FNCQNAAFDNAAFLRRVDLEAFLKEGFEFLHGVFSAHAYGVSFSIVYSGRTVVSAGLAATLPDAGKTKRAGCPTLHGLLTPATVSAASTLVALADDPQKGKGKLGRCGTAAWLRRPNLAQFGPARLRDAGKEFVHRLADFLHGLQPVAFGGTVAQGQHRDRT